MTQTSVVIVEPFIEPMRAFVAAVTERPVGDADIPAGANLEQGWCVLYFVGGLTGQGPPWWAPDAEGELVFQVTSVGPNTRHALALADRVRKGLLSLGPGVGYQVAFPQPPGWKVIRRQADGDGIPPVDVTGTSPNRVYSVADRFRLAITPDP